MNANSYHTELRNISRVLPRGVVGPKRLSLMRKMQAVSTFGSKCSEVVRVGSASVRVHQPENKDEAGLPALLWIHGGGYVMGNAAQEDRFCRRVASELGVVVAAVDYRLAPENPYPAPLHDCYEALSWLAGLSQVDKRRVAIGGPSAGGGLAAALALLARRQGAVDIAFQLLVYPALDDRTAWRRKIDESNLRLWNVASNQFGWRSYLGNGCSEVSELASPARAVDLTKLPPAWIGVGSLDLFAEEDLQYADRLRSAGVDCTVQVIEGAFHGFDVVRPRASVSRQFRADQVHALAQALGIEPRRSSSQGSV